MDAIHRAKEIRTEFGISGRVKVEALAERLGFLPWLFAYAATRVLYGVETTLEHWRGRE